MIYLLHLLPNQTLSRQYIQLYEEKTMGLFNKKSNDLDMPEMQSTDDLKKEKRPKNLNENVIGGLVGAFLGSLLGVLAIVFISRLGYVAALSGIIMGVCTLRGYELLGKSLSKMGIILSTIIALVMVYVAHRIDYALYVMEAGYNFFEAYQEIAVVIAEHSDISSEFYLNLGLLYLFTLLGLVPTIIQRFKEKKHQEALADTKPLSVTQTDELGAQQPAQPQSANFYYVNSAFDKKISKIRRLLFLPLFMMFASIFLIVFVDDNNMIGMMLLVFAIILSFVVVLFASISTSRYTNNNFCYASAYGQLWQMNWRPLYMEAGITLSALATNTPSTLSDQQRQVLEHLVEFKMQCIQSGERVNGTGVTRMDNLQVTHQNNKATQVIYMVNNKTQTQKIPNIYEGLLQQNVILTTIISPALRIGFLAVTGLIVILWIAAILITFGNFKEPIGTYDDYAYNYNFNSAYKDTTTQKLDGIMFYMQDSFRKESDNIYKDMSSDIVYGIDVTRLEDGEDAKDFWDNMLVDIDADRTSKGIHYMYEDKDFETFTNLNEVVYQYNIVTLYPDKDNISNIAVVVMENNVVVTISSDFASEDATQETALSEIHAIMSSLQPSDVVHISDVNKDNYQDLFAIQPDYEHIGKTFFKAPDEMTGEETFVDSYLPFGGTIEYLEDGYAVQAQAQGMRIYNTLKHTTGNAQTVVDDVYAEMLKTHDVALDVTGETVYESAYDIAYKLVPYYEKGTKIPRVTIIYVAVHDDVEEENYYMLEEVTYLPEQYGDYQADLLEELTYIFNLGFLEIPAIDEWTDVDNFII